MMRNISYHDQLKWRICLQYIISWFKTKHQKKKMLCGESALPELFVLRNMKMIHGTAAGVFLLNYDLFPSLCDQTISGSYCSLSWNQTNAWIVATGHQIILSALCAMRDDFWEWKSCFFFLFTLVFSPPFSLVIGNFRSARDSPVCVPSACTNTDAAARFCFTKTGCILICLLLWIQT